MKILKPWQPKQHCFLHPWRKAATHRPSQHACRVCVWVWNICHPTDKVKYTPMA